MRIIDIHTHPVFMNENNTKEDVFKVIEYGKKFGVEKMVVLGDVLLYGRNPDSEQVQQINNTTAKLLEWYPEYFIGFCFLNPLLGKSFVEDEIERCVSQYQFRGIKLEICNNARHKSMFPVMNEAKKHGIPVLQHTADQSILMRRTYESDPEDTAWLGKSFPEVQIIMAHLTTCRKKGVLEILDIPNIVLDTSAFQPEFGFVEFAVKELGAARVVYGSDLVIRDLPVEIGRVLGASISDDAKEMILFKNAQRLLGIHDTKLI